MYDRSVFIESALRGLRNTLLEIMLTVAVVILVFLGDFASAMIPIVTAPLTILIVTRDFPSAGDLAEYPFDRRTGAGCWHTGGCLHRRGGAGS